MYAAIEGSQGDGGPVPPNYQLTEREMLFIGQRDSLYLASVSQSGWPDVQHRGGAPGFIRAINPRTLIFPDFVGNQRPRATENNFADDRVAMIFVDYAKSRWLKLMGRLTSAPVEDAPYLAAEIFQPKFESEVERVGSIRVETFEWGSRRDVPPRYTAAELAPLTRRVSALEAENAILQARIASLTGKQT